MIRLHLTELLLLSVIDFVHSGWMPLWNENESDTVCEAR